MSPSLAPGKTRAHVVIDEAVLRAVQELAKRERRSVSAQLQLLLEQALAMTPNPERTG